MQIDIVSLGRFHFHDLACELAKFGHDIRYISGCPISKLKTHRKGDIQYVTTGLEILRLTLLKVFPKRHALIDDIIKKLHSQIASQLIRKNTDIVIGMAEVSGNIIPKCQKRHIPFILDRGSTHLAYHLEQMKIAYEAHNQTPAATEPKIFLQKLKYATSEYQKADFLLVPSAYVTESFISHGINSDKIKIAPYGANTEKFKNATSTVLHGRLAYVGAISLRKNVQELINVAEKLPPDYTLVVVGNCESLAKPFLRKLKALPNVEYHDWVHQNKLPAIYQTIDALVLPSYDEGLAMVQMQALASGVPVFSTINAGFSEVIEKTAAGKILPLNSFAEDLGLLLTNNDEYLLNLKENARVNRNYASWSRYADDVNNILKSILN
jgi:glycosyltransferase involved in cell wall biosynthesis